MGRNMCWKLLKSNDGTAMVEFALVGSVFTLILLGIVEFGLAAWQKNTAAADAREATRYAMVHGATSGSIATPESVTKFVKSRTSLDTAAMSIYTSWSPDKKPGSEVTVSVAHTVPRRGPFIAAHRDSVTSKMRIFF